MAENKSNPNKANQHKPDPRQALFITYYFDRDSDTFANGLQSALKAGYEPEYAKVLVANMPTWLSENIKDNDIIKKAEENLKEFLEMDTKTTITKGKIQLTVDDAGMKRIKADMTKFALERLNKKKYSARSEVTGADGEQIPITMVRYMEEVKEDDNTDEPDTDNASE